MKIPAEHAALRRVLAGAVDYAGLFPPAALDMSNAVAEYARVRSSVDRWALGRFVLPLARIDEFEVLAAPTYAVSAGDPWRLAAVAGGNADEILATVARFNARNAGGAVVDALEVRADAPDTVAVWRPLCEVIADVFVEIPAGDAIEPLVRAVGRAGAKAKLRTGGVTADAFPSPDQVLAFLVACRDAGVPCKVTAGLHHPVRGEYGLTYASDSESAPMFGFLNVFLAAAVIGAHGPSDLALRVLRATRDEYPDMVSDASGVTFAGVRIPIAWIASMREHQLIGFGSCSFSEPLDELSALIRLSEEAG